jgi:site-specific recombinase XerC
MPLKTYLKKRSSKAKGLFLVQKGPLTGTSLSVRGIQKRIEYYAKKSGLAASCPQTEAHVCNTALKC